MKNYRVQVRYSQAGEVKSVVATHLSRSASVSALEIAQHLSSKSHVAFTLEAGGYLILRAEDVLNAVVMP